MADKVKLWCKNMGIKLDYASVYHPQTNGQFERANGLIMRGIKPILVRSLKESNTHWVEELDSVLWGLRTTPNRTTGYAPFFMVYGTEAVFPYDIIHDSPRVCMYEEKEAELDRHVRTPIPSHIDLAGNTSYHFAASRTVFPRLSPYHGRDRLRLLAHVYDSVASIHMTGNPGRHD